MLGRLIITIFCAALSSALIAFIPAFWHRSLPVLSLCTAQLALVFMFVLLAFPKANYVSLMRMSRYYISFLVINFSLLTFMPIPNKLFSFGEITDTVAWLPFPFPELVSTNISGLIIINILSFLFLAILPQETAKPVTDSNKNPSPSNINIEEDLIIKAPNDLEYVGEISKANTSEIKVPEANQQVSVLEEISEPITQTAQTLSAEQIAFLEQIGAANSETSPQTKTEESLAPIHKTEESLASVYKQEPESESSDKNKLEQLEQSLLNNIDFKIDEALCMNLKGQSLEDTVFHWRSAEKSQLLDIFYAFDDFSKQNQTGELCQLVFKQANDWYMISKYQGSFLILKSSAPKPAAVLETTYRVLSQLAS